MLVAMRESRFAALCMEQRSFSGFAGELSEAFSHLGNLAFLQQKISISSAVDWTRSLPYLLFPVESGEVAEWLKALDSKSSIRESVSGVRIPPSPPYRASKRSEQAIWRAPKPWRRRAFTCAT